MQSRSALLDRLLAHDQMLRRLLPKEPLDRQLPKEIEAAEDSALAGGKSIGSPAGFALVRGGALYAADALPAAHAIFQEAHSDLGSYWHGMLHRREGDFDNARYWFRRAGALPFFAALHRDAAEYSSDMARQPNWDPYLFTGQCEQAKFGATELTDHLVQLQRCEFEHVFDYTWRQAKVGA